MRSRVVIKVVFLVLIFQSVGVYAVESTWSAWEKANSLSISSAWIVVRQPDKGFCYIKHRYDANPKKMDLSMRKDLKLRLSLPYYDGIKGKITYQIDSGKVKKVKPRKFEAVLPKSVAKKLRKAEVLTVSVKPVNSTVITQRFIMKGFNDASIWLGSKKCKQKLPDRFTH